MFGWQRKSHLLSFKEETITYGSHFLIKDMMILQIKYGPNMSSIWAIMSKSLALGLDGQIVRE